jgi:magnesium-transporting ATPase (P-type)
VAVIGIDDPIREEAKELIQICTEANINLRIVTSDDLYSTKFLAFKIGLLSPSEFNSPLVSLEGSDLKE